MHLSLQLDLRDCVTWSRGYLRQRSLSPGPLTRSQAPILNTLEHLFMDFFFSSRTDMKQPRAVNRPQTPVVLRRNKKKKDT